MAATRFDRLRRMHLDPRITIQGDISGWVLVEAQLGRGRRNYCTRLLVQPLPSAAEPVEILLPILPSGRIHELVRLPKALASLVWQIPDEASFDQPRLGIRRVSWIGRTWRMANRVVRTYIRLSRDQQSTAGLAPWRWLTDLVGAYRVATEFRVRYSYADWIKRFDTLRGDDLRMIHAHIERFPRRPFFHVLLRVGRDDSPEAREATLASLREQLYRDFTCSVFDPEGPAADAGEGLARTVAPAAPPRSLSEINASLARDDAWLILLAPGDVLPVHALYWFACGILAHPDAAIVYADDDVLNAEGERSNPRFKPEWSLAHLRATHYLGEAVAMRGTAVVAARGIRADCWRHGVYDLALRVIDAAGENVHHLPAVLLHRRYLPAALGARRAEESWRAGNEATSALPSAEWERNAVRAHLERKGIAAAVEDTRSGCRRVRYLLPETAPLVTIIVPTRDGLSLMTRCVEGLLHRTTYPRFELVVVDNQSADPATLEFLKQIAVHPAVRVLRYGRPFNFSAINNFAVRAARGAALCLLNNDTDVISPDWLEEMVGHLLQPRVGVVGAKLYYPDGRVQHAGDAVGPGGCANHLHSLIGRDEPGYCMRAAVAQDLSAVTAACLLTWREIYMQLGGLDERRLGVAFNDVDYCLRVRAAGFRVLWTPHAELYHHESVSRGADHSWRRRFHARREVATMRRRWGHVMRHDPFYNPNLSYDRPDFSLSRMPRVTRPWRAASRG